MRHLAEDGTEYETSCQGPYTLVSVVQTPFPQVKEAYKLLAHNLMKCFQPISFSLSDGVALVTPTATRYIKQISKSNDDIEVRLFGEQTIIHIPDHELHIQPPTEVILQPELFNANNTSFFSTSNMISVGNTTISAWRDIKGPFLSLQGELNANVYGELVSCSDDYITVHLEDEYRTFSLKSVSYNNYMNLLPGTFGTFWDESRHLVILSGLRVLSNETLLSLLEITTIDDVVTLKVATLANPDMSFSLNLEYSENDCILTYRSQALMRTPGAKSKCLWRLI